MQTVGTAEDEAPALHAASRKATPTTEDRHLDRRQMAILWQVSKKPSRCRAECRLPAEPAMPVARRPRPSGHAKANRPILRRRHWHTQTSLAI